MAGLTYGILCSFATMAFNNARNGNAAVTNRHAFTPNSLPRSLSISPLSKSLSFHPDAHLSFGPYYAISTVCLYFLLPAFPTINHSRMRCLEIAIKLARFQVDIYPRRKKQVSGRENRRGYIGFETASSEKTKDAPSFARVDCDSSFHARYFSKRCTPSERSPHDRKQVTLKALLHVSQRRALECLNLETCRSLRPHLIHRKRAASTHAARIYSSD